MKNYVNNSSKIKAKNFIFVLEDSVKSVDFEKCLNHISKIEVKDNYYLKFPFYSTEL